MRQKKRHRALGVWAVGTVRDLAARSMNNIPARHNEFAALLFAIRKSADRRLDHLRVHRNGERVVT
jgi:hypothetical protein